MSKKIVSKPRRVQMVTIKLEVPKSLHAGYVDFLKKYRIRPEEHLLDFVYDTCTDCFDSEYMMTTLAALVDRLEAGYAKCYEEYLEG